MRIKFTKSPTFTKGIIAAAVFTIIYLASTSNLPSCSDTLAVLNSGGECIERQSFLHTASGWLALICVIAAVLLLIVKHRVTIMGWSAQARREWSAQAGSAPAQNRPPAQGQPAAPAPVPGRTASFCATCGTRLIAGDRFCQSCGDPAGSQ